MKLQVEDSFADGATPPDDAWKDQEDFYVPRELAIPRGADGLAAEAPSYCYSLYGLHVHSDIRLPIPPIAGADARTPAWVVRRADPGISDPAPDGPVVAEIRCQHGTVTLTRHRGPSGDWIGYRGVGTFRVSSCGRRVDVYPQRGVDEDILGLVLAGPVASLVLRKLGHPCLHASAVQIGREAVAFLGGHGYGKSTIAAAFLRRGATLLTDDALPLRFRADGIDGMPGLALMKIWSDTLDGALECPEELPSVIARHDKKLFTLDGRYPFARSHVRLRALYLLERYDPAVTGRTDVTVRTLPPRESLMTLFAQTSWNRFVAPAEAAQMMPLYARLAVEIPLQVLGYPHGYEHQEAVCRQILAALEGP